MPSGVSPRNHDTAFDARPHPGPDLVPDGGGVPADAVPLLDGLPQLAAAVVEAVPLPVGERPGHPPAALRPDGGAVAVLAERHFADAERGQPGERAATAG